jgi:DNA-binding SARP family transcriptional activator/Tfp pilus assembly protein PilF
MRFGVLGPLQVIAEDGGEPGTVSAARPRVLLAVLLWRANHPVPADELAELIWDGTPPAGTPEAVRALVMRLRRRLDPRAAARIVTRAPGYMIEASGDELDASRFEALTRHAGVAVRAGHWTRAARTATEALRLWRGTPLADVPSQLLRDHWEPHLDQLRMQALDWRIEGDMHNGRHEQLIPELRDLAAHHPLREHFHSHLMLALYRCGRQAEALAAYQHARDILVAEVGVEPGPGLRELHQRILSADPALAISGLARPAEAEPEPGLPRELPSAVPGFTGRSAELAALNRLLDRSSEQVPGTVVISAIGGTAGIGKTALAVHWAHRVADSFPGGQLYVNLRGYDPRQPVSPADALAGFLRSLGVPGQDIPPGQDERAARYRSLLADKRMLIVLDNARDEQQVRPLLPGGAGCLVIVTSRSQLAGLAAAEGAHMLMLNVLSPAEARQMLSARLGNRAAAERDMVDEIARLCARLPLALAIAAAHAAARPGLSLADLAVMLDDERTRLDTLDSGDPAMDVRSVFSWSVRWLSAEAARSFCLLGLHPGPDFTASAAASLTAVVPSAAAEVLRELAAENLLTERLPGRYCFHDLLRAYASEHAGAVDEEARHAAVGRILDHYLHTACAAATLLNPTREQVNPVPAAPGVTPETLLDHRQALAWFETECQTLVAAVTQAAGNGFLEHAWRLPLALKTYLSWRGFWDSERAVLVTGLSAVRQLGDRAGEISIHRSLDHAYGRLGDYARAREHIRQARSLAHRMNDVTAEAYTHASEAWVFGAESRYNEALASSLEALHLFRESGHVPGQASALNSVGWFYAQTGDYESGQQHCGQALDLSTAIGNMHGQANALNSLGYIECRRQNPAAAIELLQEALNKVRDLGDRSAIAETLDILGDSYLAAGDHLAAADTWLEAVGVLNKVHDERSQKMLAKLRSVLGPGRERPLDTRGLSSRAPLSTYVNIRSHAMVTVPPVCPPLEELHTSAPSALHDPVEYVIQYGSS